MLLTDLLTDRHYKFLSDAQLVTLRKIPCKFQLNPSSRLGGVVRTRYFDIDDLRTYLRTDGKNFCQMHNQTSKGKFPGSLSLIHQVVQEELWPKDLVTHRLHTYGYTYGYTGGVYRLASLAKSSPFLKHKCIYVEQNKTSFFNQSVYICNTRARAKQTNQSTLRMKK